MPGAPTVGEPRGADAVARRIAVPRGVEIAGSVRGAAVGRAASRMPAGLEPVASAAVVVVDEVRVVGAVLVPTSRGATPGTACGGGAAWAVLAAGRRSTTGERRSNGDAVASPMPLPMRLRAAGCPVAGAVSTPRPSRAGCSGMTRAPISTGPVLLVPCPPRAVTSVELRGASGEASGAAGGPEALDALVRWLRRTDSPPRWSAPALGPLTGGAPAAGPAAAGAVCAGVLACAALPDGAAVGVPTDRRVTVVTG